jgi:hypothetical protein
MPGPANNFERASKLLRQPEAVWFGVPPSLAGEIDFPAAGTKGDMGRNHQQQSAAFPNAQRPLSLRDGNRSCPIPAVCNTRGGDRLGTWKAGYPKGEKINPSARGW